jgi:hypothetical protein
MMETHQPWSGGNFPDIGWSSDSAGLNRQVVVNERVIR